MADDVAGAVRRTPRPYPSPGPHHVDHQTPETTASSAPGATNAPSAPEDTRDAVSSRVSSQDEPWPADPRLDPVGTVREHDDGTTAVKVAMGNDTGKGQHVWCEMTPDLAVRWLHHDEVAEWATEREARLAELRALVAADPGALFQLGHVHDTSNDMQAFLELPDCTACGGTGKDDHATVFEAPLAVHFAGPPVRAEGRRRQLCMWCGHVLLDVRLVDGEITPAWTEGALVHVEDGLGRVLDRAPDAELPPGCCALPDDEQYDRTASSGPTTQGFPGDPESTVDAQKVCEPCAANGWTACEGPHKRTDDGPDEAQPPLLENDAERLAADEQTRAAEWATTPEDGDRD